MNIHEREQDGHDEAERPPSEEPADGGNGESGQQQEDTSGQEQSEEQSEEQPEEQPEEQSE